MVYVIVFVLLLLFKAYAVLILGAEDIYNDYYYINKHLTLETGVFSLTEKGFMAEVSF